jgi:hypothetical protein
MRNAFKKFVRKPEVKRILVRSRRRLKDVRMDLKEVG